MPCDVMVSSDRAGAANPTQSAKASTVIAANARAIARAIIQMAHSLRLRTIAEGVESEDLANLLRVFHCDEIQGYWLARPMPSRELGDFLRSHQARNVVGVQGSLL